MNSILEPNKRKSFFTEEPQQVSAEKRVELKNHLFAALMKLRIWASMQGSKGLSDRGTRQVALESVDPP